MLEDYIVCKTEYCKIGNVKIKLVPYKLSLGKRCAGLVNSVLSLLSWSVSLQMGLMWMTWAITIITWKPVTAWTHELSEPTTTLMEKNHWRLAHGCKENRGNSFNLGLWECRSEWFSSSLFQGVIGRLRLEVIGQKEVIWPKPSAQARPPRGSCLELCRDVFWTSRS